MRNIYLIRHAAPLLPAGGHICLSKTDVPLSRLGQMQCALLQRRFADVPLGAVYHSGLRRAQETAAWIDKNSLAEADLRELDVGLWEGKNFDEIRAVWPDVYAARGKDPYGCPMPGGEAPQHCLARAEAAIDRILRQTEGDVAVVTHAGVLRLLLCRWMGLPMERHLEIKIPYASVSTVDFTGEYTVRTVGERPVPPPDRALCEALLEANAVPEQVRRHCRAVEREAMCLAEGCAVDRERLSAAALLHDLCRTEREHAKVGSELLAELGYPDIAEVVACHHDLSAEEERSISEKMILYLADKQVQEDRPVSIEERFRASAEKAQTAQAKGKHEERLAQALRVRHLLDKEKAERNGSI